MKNYVIGIGVVVVILGYLAFKSPDKSVVQSPASVAGIKYDVVDVSSTSTSEVVASTSLEISIPNKIAPKPTTKKSETVKPKSIPKQNVETVSNKVSLSGLNPSIDAIINNSYKPTLDFANKLLSLAQDQYSSHQHERGLMLQMKDMAQDQYFTTAYTMIINYIDDQSAYDQRVIDYSNQVISRINNNTVTLQNSKILNNSVVTVEIYNSKLQEIINAGNLSDIEKGLIDLYRTYLNSSTKFANDFMEMIGLVFAKEEQYRDSQIASYKGAIANTPPRTYTNPINIVPQTIPTIQLPKVTHCSYQYSGWGQATMNCYESSF